MPKILEILKELYENNGDAVEAWLASQRKIAPPFFYSSVDLRHSGLRLVPVDTNLFPAGFNNLSPAARLRACQYIKQYMADNYSSAKKILIIPESHTRNLAYLDNLAVLQQLFIDAGFEIKIGNLTTEENLQLVSASGVAINQYPLKKNGDKLLLEDNYIPDLIILNNDMTSGIPDILQEILQPIIPTPQMGWFRRRKSTHFVEYQKLADDFGDKFGIDSWRLSAMSHQCGMINFKDKSSLECLAKSIDVILENARKKHAEYGISQDPFVYIKADSGTYGMGIMTVTSADEVLEINKKTRNKMQVIKEGAKVSEVIIQEGITTIDMVENAPAEPMVYMIDGVPVGGMYRINENRDQFSNLNATGMRFTGMCDEREDPCGKWQKVPNCNFRSHGIVASIAALAAGQEKY